MKEKLYLLPVHEYECDIGNGALRAQPSFIYDDFEEVWESEKGVFIEMIRGKP